MDTCMAPTYANIFMRKLEQIVLNRVRMIPTTWWRHIDDVFAIWPFGEDNLRQFLDQKNNFHPTIKFTTKWSSTLVTFYSAKVSIVEESLVTDLHTKHTDTDQFLCHHSFHPSHRKENIHFSQALRLCQICSRSEDYCHHARELRDHFLNCGYNEEKVQQ